MLNGNNIIETGQKVFQSQRKTNYYASSRTKAAKYFQKSYSNFLILCWKEGKKMQKVFHFDYSLDSVKQCWGVSVTWAKFCLFVSNIKIEMDRPTQKWQSHEKLQDVKHFVALCEQWIRGIRSKNAFLTFNKLHNRVNLFVLENMLKILENGALPCNRPLKISAHNTLTRKYFESSRWNCILWTLSNWVC